MFYSAICNLPTYALYLFQLRCKLSTNYQICEAKHLLFLIMFFHSHVSYTTPVPNLFMCIFFPCMCFCTYTETGYVDWQNHILANNKNVANFGCLGFAISNNGDSSKEIRRLAIAVQRVGGSSVVTQTSILKVGIQFKKNWNWKTTIGVGGHQNPGVCAVH